MTAGAIGANTLGVLAGCMLFGALAGAVGTFVLARRRALVADVAGHAALPGVALAFLAGEALGLGGRTPWLLLLGGAATALLAAWCVPALSRLRRIGPDGATAVVLAGFFGLGAVLFSIVQGHPAGSQGGLRTLLFGSAAAMGRAEVVALLALATVTLALLIVFLRGLTVVAFDEDFARSAGLPVRGLDLLLTVLLVATVVAGMQMAGIVLVVAMVITPAAAARNLGGRIESVTAIAAILGAVTAAAGVIASRAVAGVPTGAAMTLAATAAFLITVPFGHLARGARA
jgi:manganese/zinc/iron transport system permease protein